MIRIILGLDHRRLSDKTGIQLISDGNQMDIFLLLADVFHVTSMAVLLEKILRTRNVSGISYKMQEIYAVVFVTRYIDIFLGWGALYLFIMKFLYTGLTVYICYLFLLKKPTMYSYNKDLDDFPHYFLYGAAAIMTMIIHKSFLPLELLWSYSQWLEAFTILPQLKMIYKTKSVQNLTAGYIVLMGFYRLFYAFHWFYVWQSVLWTQILAGTFQLILYSDFIYYFLKANKNDKIMKLAI